ncbi:MAG: hypothetical protein LBT59_19210 [Clostridiales bacterium]|nr:hypothetical protein [Clostridiales bacterium]
MALDLDGKIIKNYTKAQKPSEGPLAVFGNIKSGIYAPLHPLNNSTKGYVFKTEILNIIVSLILRHDVEFTSTEHEHYHATVKFDLYGENTKVMFNNEILRYVVSFDVQVRYYPYSYAVRPSEYLHALCCCARRSSNTPAGRAINIFVNLRHDLGRHFVDVTGLLRDGRYVSKEDGSLFDFDEFGYGMIIEVNLDKISTVTKEQREYGLAGVFLLYSHHLALFEEYCNGLKDDPDNSQKLIDRAKVLADHMKDLHERNVALVAYEAKGPDDRDWILKVSEEGMKVPIVAPYFEDIVAEFEKKMKDKDKEMGMANKNNFITLINNFLTVQKTSNNMALAAQLVPVPIETCEKMAGKKVDIAYKICMTDKFNAAANAFKSGKSIEEVKLQTQLSLKVLEEIKKNPEVEIKGRVYTKYENLAWVVDD